MKNSSRIRPKASELTSGSQSLSLGSSLSDNENLVFRDKSNNISRLTEQVIESGELMKPIMKPFKCKQRSKSAIEQQQQADIENSKSDNSNSNNNSNDDTGKKRKRRLARRRDFTRSSYRRYRQSIASKTHFVRSDHFGIPPDTNVSLENLETPNNDLDGNSLNILGFVSEPEVEPESEKSQGDLKLKISYTDVKRIDTSCSKIGSASNINNKYKTNSRAIAVNFFRQYHNDPTINNNNNLHSSASLESPSSSRVQLSISASKSSTRALPTSPQANQTQQQQQQQPVQSKGSTNFLAALLSHSSRRRLETSSSNNELQVITTGATMSIDLGSPQSNSPFIGIISPSATSPKPINFSSNSNTGSIDIARSKPLTLEKSKRLSKSTMRIEIPRISCNSSTVKSLDIQNPSDVSRTLSFEKPESYVLSDFTILQLVSFN